MFGFDWNGDGNVDFFESMLTLDMLEEMEEEQLQIDIEYSQDDNQDEYSNKKKKRGLFG